MKKNPQIRRWERDLQALILAAQELYLVQAGVSDGKLAEANSDFRKAKKHFRDLWAPVPFVIRQHTPACKSDVLFGAGYCSCESP